jgi:hypothetical protein
LINFKDLNIRKHWCGNVQKLALTHTHAHRHAWHEHKKWKKSQANWNGNFSKPVKFENLPSENNGQDAQNQNFQRVLLLNLIQTIKRRVSLFGQIPWRQMALMARRLIVAPRIACRVFGWPTTSLLLVESRHQEITRVILCRLIYIVMSFKPFNDIIMIVCKFLIGLCCLRSYST